MASEDFIQLYSGTAFHFMDPNPDDILVDDIAHTLSLLCRFGGHCKSFYSVAQHSVYCSHHVATGFEFEALMHDAAEAYLVDMPRPIKNVLPGYKDLEIKLDTVIRNKFNLPVKMSDEVHYIDNAMLATERRDLMSSSAKPWVWLPDPLNFTVEPWSPEEAADNFMKRYKELAS